MLSGSQRWIYDVLHSSPRAEEQVKLRCLLFFLLLSASLLKAQKLSERNLPAGWEAGVVVRQAQIYLSPDTSSNKIGELVRGRTVIVMERSRGWAHVQAELTPDTETAAGKTLTGWMVDKGIITDKTPDGDKILFGEGSASELQAAMRGGRKGAAEDARRLYYHTYDLFPQSPLAAEGLYRAADILWQMEAADIGTLPSSKMRDPNLHETIDERYMKMVIKQFPGTKFADLAAYHLLENKLCGDWEGQSKCPEKESDMYEKYAKERPNSPTAPEALYNSARRRAALIEIYKTENKAKQVEESRDRAKATAQLIISKYPQTDWAQRARALVYMVEQGIPMYGNAVE
jgi:outer membrane protein assembly factor BamD (BamD/ComL family)